MRPVVVVEYRPFASAADDIPSLVRQVEELLRTAALTPDPTLHLPALIVSVYAEDV